MNTTPLSSTLSSTGTTELDANQAVRQLAPVHKAPLWLRPLRAFTDLVYLSARRLRYHAGLSLLSLLGFVLAIALVSSAAFFSNAVDTVIMRQELAEYSRVTGRPALSSRIYSPSSRVVPLTLEDWCLVGFLVLVPRSGLCWGLLRLRALGRAKRAPVA